jgi:hypothetical protein
MAPHNDWPGTNIDAVLRLERVSDLAKAFATNDAVYSWSKDNDDD